MDNNKLTEESPAAFTRRLCRLLRRSNTAAMPAAVSSAACVAASLLLATAFPGAGVRAAEVDDQIPPPPEVAPQAAPQTSSQGAPEAAPLLDWSHARRVFPYLEACVEAGDVDPVPRPAPVWVADVQGARVTIRWLGRTMGKGDALLPLTSTSTAAGANLAATRPPVIDLVPLVRDAVAAALAEVHQGLADRNQRARQRADDADAFKPWTPADLRPLRVDLQLARGPQPVRLPPDAPEHALFRQFAPGYHGLMTPIAHTGNTQPPSAPGSAGGSQNAGSQNGAHQAAAVNPEAIVWPATALAMNQSPPAQVRQLLRVAGTPPLELNEQISRVARPDGLPLARFEVIHMVRLDETKPPVQLVRGNVVLPPASVTSDTLADMADQMIQFLLRRQTAEGDFLGTYHPTGDQFDPARASLEDVALAAYVLARRADMIDDAQGQGPGRIHAAAENALRYLNRRYTPSDAPDEPAAQALTLLAVMAMDDSGERPIERDVLGQRLIARFVDRPHDGPPAAAPQRALVALALTTYALQSGVPRDAGPVARQAAAELIEQVEAAHVVTALPWYAMALRAAARLPADAAPASDALSPAAVRQRLADLVEQMRPIQVAADARLGPDDVVGGFDLLPGGQPGLGVGPSAPVADWRSANVLATMALALREAGQAATDLDEPQRQQAMVRQVVDCGRAARFLHQLMFTNDNAYYARSLPDVLGGIRPALWDNRLSTAPTAMALLAVTELQQALDALSLP